MRLMAKKVKIERDKERKAMSDKQNNEENVRNKEEKNNNKKKRDTEIKRDSTEKLPSISHQVFKYITSYAYRKDIL